MQCYVIADLSLVLLPCVTVQSGVPASCWAGLMAQQVPAKTWGENLDNALVQMQLQFFKPLIVDQAAGQMHIHLVPQEPFHSQLQCPGPLSLA